jgi:RNA polymerase sigma factor (TIGR02999 family)
MSDVTTLLLEWQGGKQSAFNELAPLVEGELRRLAKGYLRREKSDHTLQSTALVNEAWIRLIDQSAGGTWQNRAHFVAIAARLMRQILVDHARANQAEKRGSGKALLALDEALGVPERGGKPVGVVALDDALERLAQLDPQQAQIIEMRFFGGLTIEETAEALHISPATVKRDWTIAKGWLFRELSAN